MLKKLCMTILLSQTTISCGTSTTEDLNRTSYDNEQIGAFFDGSGVVSSVNSQNIVQVGIVPSVDQLINASEPSNLITFSPTDFPVTSIRNNGNLVRSGSISTNNASTSVLAVQDIQTQTIVYWIDNPDSSNGVVSSGRLTNNLPTGNFVYSGSMVAGIREANVAPVGSVTIYANFDRSTFNITGTNGLIDIQGAGVIDPRQGSFESKTMTLTTLGVPSPGDLYGNFHGSNGAAASGVFHTKELDPKYTGGFIATQE